MTPERREYEREYWARNKERKREIDRRYRAKHKERLAAELRAWREANPEKYKAQKERSCKSPSRKEWLAANHESHRKYLNERHARLYRESPQHRMRHVLRGRFAAAFRKGKRSHSLANLIGCSWEELVAHIEAQFKPGMTWDNHGRHTWHIDHITPLMAFDLTDPEQQLRAFHYTNLRPLAASENWAKGHRERRIYGV